MLHEKISWTLLNTKHLFSQSSKYHIIDLQKAASQWDLFISLQSLLSRLWPIQTAAEHHDWVINETAFLHSLLYTAEITDSFIQSPLVNLLSSEIVCNEQEHAWESLCSAHRDSMRSQSLGFSVCVEKLSDQSSQYGFGLEWSSRSWWVFDKVLDCLFLRIMNKASLKIFSGISTDSLIGIRDSGLSDCSEFIPIVISETETGSGCTVWSASADSNHVSADSDRSPDMLPQSWLSFHCLLDAGLLRPSRSSD